MQFSINTDTLKKEINLIQGLADTKSGVAALSNLLIEATDTGILLTATDIDITIQTKVTADVKEKGSVCISAKKLCDIIRSLDTGTVTFKTDANDWSRITCNTSKFRVSGLSKEHFPTIAEINANEVTIDGDTIKAMIKHTFFAVTEDESRFAINGAKLEISEGKAKMVATDGHRIALMEESIDDIEATLDVLIPKKALTEILKFAANELVITDSPNHLKFTSGDRLLITRKLTMDFPNYQLAMPKGNDVEVSFDADEMVKALKRVAIMADDRSRAIALTLNENKMVLTSVASGESEETVKCTVDNYPEDGMIINVNWQFLAEFLAVCQTPVFYLKDGLSVIKVVDNTSIYILMPLRQN